MPGANEPKRDLHISDFSVRSYGDAVIWDQRVRPHRRMLTPSSTRGPELVDNEFVVVRKPGFSPAEDGSPERPQKANGALTGGAVPMRFLEFGPDSTRARRPTIPFASHHAASRVSQLRKSPSPASHSFRLRLHSSSSRCPQWHRVSASPRANGIESGLRSDAHSSSFGWQASPRSHFTKLRFRSWLSA
jgi:hypothetical protein